MEIFCDSSGAFSLTNIERWYKVIDETGSISLTTSPSRHCTIRTKGTINKVKRKLQNGKVSIQKFAVEFGIFQTSVWRVLRDDLGYRSCKYLIEPAPTEDHKIQRKRCTHWIRTNFWRERILRSVFFDEKC